MRSRYLSTGDKLAVNFFLCLDCFDFLDIFSSLYTSNAATIEQRSSTPLHRSFVQFFFQSSQALVAVTQVGNKRVPLRFLPLFLVQPSDSGQIASRLLVIFTTSPIDESLDNTLVQANRFIRFISLLSYQSHCTFTCRASWQLEDEFSPGMYFHCCARVSIMLYIKSHDQTTSVHV